MPWYFINAYAGSFDKFPGEDTEVEEHEAFITGASRIPPLGVGSTAEVRFLYGKDMFCQQHVHVCTSVLSISLPSHTMTLRLPWLRALLVVLGLE